MECFSYLRNIQDLLSDGKTPYARRFEEPETDQLFRLVHWLSVTLILRKTSQESINLERKSYLDCFLDTHAGGIWKGDVLVADLEELATMGASEIYSKRLNAKEVIFQKQIENSFSRRRTSTLMRDHPIRGEGQRDFLGDLEGSPPSPLQDSYPVAGEASNDFCSMSGNFTYHHHVEPRVTLYSPRRVIPYSTEIHWCLQNYSYKLGCNARRPLRWLLEYRWIQRFVWFLDRFHSFYSVKWETSRRIYVVREETDKTASDIQARSYMARTLEEIVKKCKAEGEAEMGKWETKAR